MFDGGLSHGSIYEAAPLDACAPERHAHMATLGRLDSRRRGYRLEWMRAFRHGQSSPRGETGLIEGNAAQADTNFVQRNK